MQRFILPFLIFTGLGCTTLSGRKTTSNWLPLATAEEAKCASWPILPKDLRVDELQYVPGAKPGFLASVTKRDGSKGHYFADFKDEVRVDGEDLRELSLGRGALLVGGMAVADKVFAVVIQNTETKSTVELRGVRDNVIKSKVDLPAANIREAFMWASNSGFWLIYEAESGAQLAWMEVKGDKATLHGSRSVDLASHPVVIPADKASSLLVARQSEAASGLRVRVLNREAGNETDLEIPVKVEEGLESWTMARNASGHVLALVDGDSLVGQAKLRVSQLSWGSGVPSVSWSKDLPLKDVHASEPLFISTQDGLQVLLLNWVDEESSIARYMVAAGSVSKPKYSGVFPKGARILSAFPSTDADDIYVVVRHRRDAQDESAWHFKLCRI